MSIPRPTCVRCNLLIPHGGERFFQTSAIPYCLVCYRKVKDMMKDQPKCDRCGVEVDPGTVKTDPLSGTLCVECFERGPAPGKTYDPEESPVVVLKGTDHNGEHVEETIVVPTDGTEVTSETAFQSIGDPVEHPPHYTMGPVEVIDALESFFPGVDFHKANAIKYLARAGHKGDELEDLKKARWYVDRAIKKLEG